MVTDSSFSNQFFHVAQRILECTVVLALGGAFWEGLYFLYWLKDYKPVDWTSLTFGATYGTLLSFVLFEKPGICLKDENTRLEENLLMFATGYSVTQYFHSLETSSGVWYLCDLVKIAYKIFYSSGIIVTRLGAHFALVSLFGEATSYIGKGILEVYVDDDIKRTKLYRIGYMLNFGFTLYQCYYVVYNLSYFVAHPQLFGGECGP